MLKLSRVATRKHNKNKAVKAVRCALCCAEAMIAGAPSRRLFWTWLGLFCASPLLIVCKPGCTDVLEGCCTSFASNDCDLIPYNNMLEGLQCLPPTAQQCSQMYIDCVCPVSGAAIDSWETPCVPVAAVEQVSLCISMRETFIN